MIQIFIGVLVDLNHRLNNNITKELSKLLCANFILNVCLTMFNIYLDVEIG